MSSQSLLTPRSKLAAVLSDNHTAVLTEVVTALSPDIMQAISDDFERLSKEKSQSIAKAGSPDVTRSMTRKKSVDGVDLPVSAGLNRSELVELLEYHLISKPHQQVSSIAAGLYSPRSMKIRVSTSLDSSGSETSRPQSLKEANVVSVLPYSLFTTPALQDRRRRLFAFSTLFDYCDDVGSGSVTFQQLASFVTDVAANDLLSCSVAANVSPFKLDRVLTSMPTQKANNFLASLGLGKQESKESIDSIRNKLGAAATTRKVMCLKNVNLLAVTDLRHSDVTLLRLDTLTYVGTLKTMSGLPASSAVSHIEAAVAFQGYFSDGTVDPSHAYMCTAASDATLTLWNISPADASPFGDLLTWPSFYPQQCLAFNERYNALYSGCTRGPIRLWDITTGSQLKHLDGHTNVVPELVNMHSLDGLASCSFDRTIRIWDVLTSQQRLCLTGHEAPVTSISFSSPYRILMSGCADHTVNVWSPFVNKPLHILRAHDAPIVSVRASPDSPEAITADKIGRIVCWDMRMWKQMYAWNVGDEEAAPLQPKYVPTKRKLTVAYSVARSKLAEEQSNTPVKGPGSTPKASAALNKTAATFSAVDILPTPRGGGLGDAAAGGGDVEDDNAGGVIDTTGQDGPRAILLACMDYCRVPAKSSIKPENDLWAEHEALSLADSAFAQRYAAIRRASQTRLALTNMRRPMEDRDKPAGPASQVVTTSTGLKFRLPPPLVGMPKLAGIYAQDSEQESAGTGDASSVMDDGVGSRAGADSADAEAGKTVGALFIAARSLFAYKQVADDSLQQKAAPNPVIYVAYLPYDQSVLVVSGRDVDVWCVFTGTRKRSFAAVTLQNIVAAQVYAHGRRLALSDAQGTFFSLSTLTGGALAIFETPGMGEISTMACDEAEFGILASARLNGTIFVHVDSAAQQGAVGDEVAGPWYGTSSVNVMNKVSNFSAKLPGDDASVVVRLLPKVECRVEPGDAASDDGLRVGSGSELYALCVSKKDRLVCCGGSDHAVSLFDLETGKLEARMGTAGDVLSILVLPNEPLMVTGDSSGTISVWGLRTTGRSFGLLAAFRNQPLAFAALYKSNSVVLGMVAKSSTMMDELNEWSDLVTARGKPSSVSAPIISTPSHDTPQGRSPALKGMSAYFESGPESPLRPISRDKRIPALALSGQKYSATTARGRPFPKPAAVVRLDFCVSDMTLYSGDDSGVVCAWDLTVIAREAARAAEASRAALHSPTASSLTASKVVKLGFPDGGVSVQSAITFLEGVGVAPGTFPREAAQMLAHCESFPTNAFPSNAAGYETVRRGSMSYNNALYDPALAVLPVLLHAKTEGNTPASVASSPLPGPELVKMLWSSKLHPDAVSCLRLVSPCTMTGTSHAPFEAFVISCSFDRTAKIVDRSSGSVVGMLAFSSKAATLTAQKSSFDFDSLVHGRQLQVKRGAYWKVQLHADVLAAAIARHVDTLSSQLVQCRLLRERGASVSSPSTTLQISKLRKAAQDDTLSASMSSSVTHPTVSTASTPTSAQHLLEQDKRNPRSVLSPKHWMKTQPVTTDVVAKRAASALSVVLGKPVKSNLSSEYIKTPEVPKTKLNVEALRPRNGFI